MSTNKRVIFARVIAGLALVEGCSLFQGAYGDPTDAAEEVPLHPSNHTPCALLLVCASEPKPLKPIIQFILNPDYQV